MSAGQRQPVRRVSPRLPLPASVYMYNVVGNNLHASSLRSKQWFYHHRPEPDAKLLSFILLELIVSQEVGDDANGKEIHDTSDSKNERTLFSQIVSRGTIQPVWHHLNESIDLEQFSVEEYESMTLRLYLLENNDGQKVKKTAEGLLWQEVPIHPSRLSRLARLPVPQKEKLPLNFIALEYTDKTLRILPSHHHSLAEMGSEDLILDSNKVINHGLINREHATEDDFGRFEDTVFRTLDQVTSVARPDDADSMKPVANDLSLSQNEMTSEEESEGKDAVILRRRLLVLEGTRRSVLQKSIQAEEQFLRRVQSNLKTRNHRSQAIKQCLQSRNLQSLQIRTASKDQRRKGHKTLFGLQAQQIRLVHELQALFPITCICSGERQCFNIRGLELPPPGDSLFGVAEEDLSAALGYLCHLIHMLSKYLAIQLRYRLFCHNSRSGIQDDKAVLYPLFLQSRTAAERDLVEHGIGLLHRNVESILRDQNVEVSPSLHILGKVKRIYEHLKDGY